MIRVLPEDLVDKIAAGEVIERPASVAKELVENAIDAESRRIIIDIEDAGQKLIRITDNGTGMTGGELRLALTRHATSKLISFDGLQNLMTLGFRGEALPSIAAVSNFRIQTQSKDTGEPAWEISVRGGAQNKDARSSRTIGTTVEVRDIFFNTPVRKKFLRKIPTEKSQIIRTVEELAIAHPAIAFVLTSDGREIFDLPAGQTLNERLRSLLGKMNFDRLTRAEGSVPGVRLEGYVSKIPQWTASRREQYFFINRRPISSRTITRALYDSYRGQIPAQRHPSAVLTIEIDPRLIDVNVHPTKREVRITREHDLYQAVTRSISTALQTLTAAPVFSAPGISADRSGSVREAVETFYAKNSNLFNKTFSPTRPFQQTEEPELVPGTSFKDASIRVIGQFNRLYILAESGGELLIIDQHAAEEKILFEEFIEKAGDVSTSAQKLLVPYRWEMTSAQYALMQSLLDEIKSIGLAIEDFGENSLLIREVPQSLGDIQDVRSFLELLVENLSINTGTAKNDIVPRREMLIRAACRAAVKSRDPLAGPQIEALIRRLKNCKQPFTCPHGRPTLTRLNRHEIDRRFGR